MLRAVTDTIELESIPPLRYAPTGTSDTSCRFTACVTRPRSSSAVASNDGAVETLNW